MQDGKQRFWARLQLLVRLTLNTPNYAANEPARLAQLDGGNDRAILLQGDEGPAQSLPWRKPGSFGWGIAAPPSVRCSDEVAISSSSAPYIFRSPARRTQPQRRSLCSVSDDGAGGRS
jgi:hypothetical protein